MLRPSALIFDMDGLMVDSEPSWFEVEREFVEARGAEWTPALAHACIGRGLRHAAVTIAELCRVAIDVDEGVAELVSRFVARLDGLRLKPGCAELLAEARGRLPIAVASSSTRYLVETTLGRFGIPPRLDALVSGDDVARAKPAPDIFLEAARRLGVAPERCVVFEDSLAGATAGHAARMPVIAVPEKWPAAGFDLVATHVVKDLFEARALLDLGG